MKPVSTLLGPLKGGVYFAGLLALWELAARTGIVAALFFPAPSSVFLRLFSMISDGSLTEHVGATLLRVVVGVVIGGGAGLVLGLLMGLSSRANAALDWLVSISHPLPKIALLPLFLVFFGYGETARLVLVGLSAAFPMIIAARTAVYTIDPLLIDVCAAYQVTGYHKLRRLILPACRPLVIAGLRISINTALIVAISVEMLAANEGLGVMLWFGWQTMRLEDIYGVLIIIGLFGLIISKAFNWAETPITKLKRKTR